MKSYRYATFALLVLLVSVGAVAAQTTIPASLKATPGSWNPAVPGFAVRSHQIAVTRITTATVGNVKISWTAAGVLEESTNMAGQLSARRFAGSDVTGLKGTWKKH